MAKAKKRVATRKKSSKRGKASAKPARKKAAKRATPKKAKSKVRRAGKSATKPAAKKKRPPKTAARKAPRQVAEVPVETTIIDVIEEPVPGVVVVTEYESVRTVTPISPGGEPEAGEAPVPRRKNNNRSKARSRVGVERHCGTFVGLLTHPARNQSLEDPINDPTSRCSVRVLPSEEDAQIAAHTSELASGGVTVSIGVAQYEPSESQSASD